MVSPLVPSFLNCILPQSLTNYRMKEVINKFEKSKRDSNSKPVDSSYSSNIDSPKCTSIILKPALDINNNDQHINNYTIIVTKTDKKIIVDEENAKSIKEDRMLEISVKHCKINKNIDEIVKVAIMESVVHKIKNVASTETIDDKNLNHSVSINNHINNDNSNRSDEGSNHAERFTILHTNLENNNNRMIVKKKLEYLTTNTDLTKINTNEVSNSCVFIKDRSLTQNRNNNTSTTTLSPFIISQSCHNPRKKSTTVNDTTFQMTSNDEKYHSPVISTPSHKTKIRNEDSKELVINLTKYINSITGERTNQDDRFDILQIRVDNNSNNMIVKQKIDYISNNTDLKYLKTFDVSRSSDFNRKNILTR